MSQKSRKSQKQLENKKKVIAQRKSRAGGFDIQLVTNGLWKSMRELMQLVAELNKRGKLHGIDHFVNTKYHSLERLLWFTLVIAAFYGVFYVGNNQMERYRANPTVISLERGTFIAL